MVKILLADGEPVQTAMLQNRLEANGCGAVSANDGESGLLRLRRRIRIESLWMS